MAAKRKKAGVDPAATPGAREVRTVTETVELVNPTEEIDLLPDDSQAEDNDFAGVLADLAGGSEARCEIRRTSPSEFAGYCCTYAVSEMTLDRLQSEWGGGKFSIRVRDSRGEFKGSTNVQIVGRPKYRDDAPAVVSPAAPAPSMAGELAPVLKAIQDSTQGQIALLTNLVTNLLNKTPPAPEKGPDTLEIISQLAPILRPEKAQEAGSVAEGMKLFREGLEMGRELAGGGGDGDTFTNLALKGIDMVKTVAQTAPPRPAVRRQALPPRQVPRALPQHPPGSVAAEEPARVEQPQQEASPMLKLLGWIKQQTTLLVYQAARGKNPELYAELFLDNLPDGVTYETIAERLSGENAIQELADITGNAQVMKHVPWFEAFRAAVLEQLVDDEEETAGTTVVEIPDQQPGGGE